MTVPFVPGGPGPLPLRHLSAAAVGAVTLLLYGWPVIAGLGPAGFTTADRGLQLLAATGAAAACLLAAAASTSVVRAAWSLIALGTTSLACAMAVSAGTGSGPLTPEQFVLAAQAALALVATAALMVLTHSPEAGRPALQLVDGGLVGTGIALLAWAAGPGWSGAALTGADAVLIVAASGLLGSALLALVRTAKPLRQSGGLGGGLGLIAAAALWETAARAWQEQALVRPGGAAAFAGLVLVSLAALPSSRVELPEFQPASEPAMTLVLHLPAVVGAVVLTAAALLGTPPDSSGVALVMIAVALSWVRMQLLVREGRGLVTRLAGDERRMRHQAFHDQLTGLANRHLLLDRLEHALAVHARARRPVALLFCDLDGFKDVNDRFGHDTGDRVLRVVAERMSACIRPTDTLARVGGDEFAVLLDDGDQPDVVAGRLLRSLENGAGLPPGAASLRMSVGVALVGMEDPTPTVGELFSRADDAMYEMKRQGRRGHEEDAGPAVIAELPAVSADERALVRAALAHDLAAGRLEVVYQPLVEPADGTVVGVEALARWRFAGIDVPPQSFVELAEQAGLGSVLTDVVLDRAAAQVRRWSAALGHDRLTVSVKLTTGELDDASLPTRVTAVVLRHNLHPGQLVLETTAAALGDGSTARRLIAAGAVLSLVSTAEFPVALSALHDLPLGAMKVAGRPVGGDDGAAETQVRVLRAIGRELDLRVIVERVESSEQLAVVRRLGGLLAQGFLLARPAPADQIDEVVLHGCPVPI